MRTQVIVFAALAGLVGACTSGDGGTAAIPFDPFGSESAPATTEPTSGGNEAPPGSGAVSIQDLCEYDCQRFAACPSYGGCDASTCSQLESAFPNCKTQLQAYLSCIAKAPIECGSYGPEIPQCSAAADAFSSCANGTYYLSSVIDR